MTVAVLLIAHQPLGKALFNISNTLMSEQPMPFEYIDVNFDEPCELIVNKALKKISEMDQGGGVLVLTDMYGSTPSNVAAQLSLPNKVEVITGLNLPMLIRTLNYPSLSLPELSQKALSGGQDGIMIARKEE